MVPQNLHDLFAATAGISGALIGLLFVALSVSRQQLFAHRIRAGAAMTMFLNVLLVSLFGMLSGSGFSGAVAIIAVVGVGYITLALIAWFRERRQYPSQAAALRDLAFLVGIMALLIYQFIIGTRISASSSENSHEFNSLGVLVIICFLIGISRAWELVGGPSIGISGGVAELSSDLREPAKQQGSNSRSIRQDKLPSGQE